MRSVVQEMDQSEKASMARCKLVLGAMAASDGNPIAKRKIIRSLCRADPKVRSMARAVQSFYFPKEERICL